MLRGRAPALAVVPRLAMRPAVFVRAGFALGHCIVLTTEFSPSPEKTSRDSLVLPPSGLDPVIASSRRPTTGPKLVLCTTPVRRRHGIRPSPLPVHTISDHQIHTGRSWTPLAAAHIRKQAQRTATHCLPVTYPGISRRSCAASLGASSLPHRHGGRPARDVPVHRSPASFRRDA